MRTAFAAYGALFLVSGLALPHISQAAQVSVTTVDNRVTIEATDAGIDEVLTRLGEAHGFQLQVPANAANFDSVSGRFEGSLRSVLSRLLDNESHMIVHSATAKSGIARIVLFGSNEQAVSGTAPTALTPAVVVRPVAARSRTAVAVTQAQPLAREIISVPPQSRAVPPVPIRTRSGVN